MSTVTSKSIRERVEAHIPRMISMSPAPCRMIQIDVYECEYEDGSGRGHAVSWSHVVGVLCIVETEYAKIANRGQDYPSPGATDAEMTDKGWTSCHPPNWFPVVWPVLADGNSEDEYPLRVWHERNRTSNAIHHAIVPCFWPPEQDQENAVRIGKELIEKQGSRSPWAEIRIEETAP
jgi:hypothetical protein